MKKILPVIACVLIALIGKAQCPINQTVSATYIWNHNSFPYVAKSYRPTCDGKLVSITVLNLGSAESITIHQGAYNGTVLYTATNPVINGGEHILTIPLAVVGGQTYTVRLNNFMPAGSTRIYINGTLDTGSGLVFYSANGSSWTNYSERNLFSTFNVHTTITDRDLPTTICRGTTIDVPYDAAITFDPSNVFTAQLSNASGSFSSPVNIGSVIANTSGIIQATIPIGTVAGNGYRIRVISSSPSQTGTNNGKNIAIKSETSSIINQTACESYMLNGTTYNSTGSYTQLVPSAHNCDSTITLHLTINNGTHSVHTETACESYEWNGTTYTTSGTKLYNYTNGNGCPSTDTLHLTINNGTHNTSTETACESYEWNGVTYTTSGTKLYNYTNGNGCPSTDTLHLTINNGTHNVEAETACESYEWNGVTYTTSGTKLYNYTNGNGCPSTDTLHLTINNGTHNVDTETVCESYEWNGATYITSGTKLYNYTNGNGCPSTDTLHLTINNGTYNVETETACESYEWNGTTYTTSGTKLYNYTNANGCPSTDTLHLNINNGTHNVDTETVCESFEWNGVTYTTSGTKLYDYTNGSGCSSTDTLHLTINNGTHNVSIETACESFDWNGATYTTSGTKLYNYMNANGCPSTDTLHLTINSVDAAVSLVGVTLTANLSGASYQWIDCDDNDSPIAGETAQTFTALQNGNYAVIVSNGTCEETSDCVSVNTVGIALLNQNKWNIYPNPTSGMFTISTSHLLDNALVEIHSADGKLIYTTVFSGTEMNFNIVNGPPGVYILRVDNKDTFRVIKN